MKLNELANKLATAAEDALQNDAAKVSVTAVISNKKMAQYGRKLQPGCIALRVYIETPAAGYTGLGEMELFVPVSKKRLRMKGNFDNMVGSVLRYVGESATYRQDMIAKVQERMAEAA